MSKKSFLTGILSPDKTGRQMKEIAQAHKKAEKIIEKAVLKSEQLLQDTALVNNKWRAQIETKLGQVLDAIGPELKTLAAKQMSAVFADFSRQLQTILKEKQTMLDNEVNREMAKINQELQQYREERKKQIDAFLIERVDILAKQIVGQTISTKDHQELIMHAIEKAKKTGIF